MTMMMTNSQFGLDDTEALLWGPSSPTADDMGSVFYNPEREERRVGGGVPSEGGASPLASSSPPSSSSPPRFYSPPPSPPTILGGNKAGDEYDLPSLPWLGHPDQLRCNQAVSGDRTEDEFVDLDWMAEKMDLGDFDLESLIGSCSSTEEASGSPEDFLSSLDCTMELDALPMSTALTAQEPPCIPPASPPYNTPSPLPPVCDDASVITVDDSESFIDEQSAQSSPVSVHEPQEELEIKSEPASPESSTSVVDPHPPEPTLDLGSEVDVSESEMKPALAAVVPQVQRLVFSLSPTRIVFVLTPKSEVGITTTVTATPKVIHSPPPASPAASPPQRSSRSRPYPDPMHSPTPPSPGATSVKVKPPQGAPGDERVSLKAPKDKKVKKMEQNKTAATRYRQKKRAEQDSLLAEHAVLERKNVELTEKAESMAREIEYLKELMEEVRLARVKKGLSPDL